MEGSKGGGTHLVTEAKLLLAKLHAPTQTLGHAVALLVKFTRELEADSPEPRPTLVVNAEAGSELADDGAKVARLQTRRRYEGAE